MAQLRVRVTTKASEDVVVGIRDGELQVRVRAVPEGGKANVAVCAAVAKALGVPKTSVSVARGGTSRMKVVELATLGDIELADALAGLSDAP